jgi:hypothetical protein
MQMFCWVAVLDDNMVLISTNHWWHSRKHVMEIAYICLSHSLGIAINKLQKPSHAGGIPNYNNLRLRDYMKIHHDTAMYRLTATQHLQHTHGQLYRSNVFCGLCMDHSYAACARHVHTCMVMSQNNRVKWGRLIFSVGPCQDRCYAAVSSPMDWLVSEDVEPQQMHTQQWRSCVFCVVWSVPRLCKSAKFWG